VVVFCETTRDRMMSIDTTNKPFMIEKRQVYEAYKAVKSNKGAAGVDGRAVQR
jgi:RNA-directed DNA polymerase